MPAPLNRLKADLAAGKTCTGLWLTLAHPTTAAIAAGAGYDWCLIDAEHGPNTVATTLAQAQAMEGRGAACVARVTENRPDLIKQMLDIGIQTLLIPMVETPEDARAAVAACRYPPQGVRGNGALLARATDWGTITDYVQTANAQICIIVQVETRQGLDNLDAILAVDGVDCVFIGPADLAADMGYPGQADAPRVTAAIEDALAQIVAAGITPGIVGFDIADVGRYARLGARFLGVGADATTLAASLRALSAAADKAIGRG